MVTPIHPFRRETGLLSLMNRLATFGLFLALLGQGRADAQVISLDAAESSSYRQYTYTMTAAASTTWLSFFFRHDPAFWGFDDVSFSATSGGSNLVTNSGFESGTLGWGLIGRQGLPYAGYVNSGAVSNNYYSPRSGSKWWYDGAMYGTDGIAQAIATVPGESYTLSFYLAGGTYTSSPGSVLFQAYVGDAFSAPQFTQVSTGTISSGTVTAQSGQQLNVPTANGGTIDSTAGYASVGNLDGATLTVGTSGAAITTFSSGVINAVPNSSVTIATFSSGSLSAGANSSVVVTTMQSGEITAGASGRVVVGTLSSGSIATSVGSSLTVTQGGDFTGSINGSGRLVMDGAGTLTMSSSNSFTGGTEISNGTVQVAVSNALGSAPVRLVNNGRFRAMTDVDVSNDVVSQSPNAVYEHVFDSNDSLTNYASFSYAYGDSTASIGAGDYLASGGTVSSHYAQDGTLTIDGLDGTAFLLVMDMDGLIPVNASADAYYLGWFDPSDSTWKNATLGNHGTAGTLAGGYSGLSYQDFLSSHDGWNSALMLGAYGVDWVHGQVWAVIDHNSEFGVALDGEIHLVPEPSTSLLAVCGGIIATIVCRRRIGRRSSRSAQAWAGMLFADLSH